MLRISARTRQHAQELDRQHMAGAAFRADRNAAVAKLLETIQMFSAGEQPKWFVEQCAQ